MTKTQITRTRLNEPQTRFMNIEHAKKVAEALMQYDRLIGGICQQIESGKTPSLQVALVGVGNASEAEENKRLRSLNADLLAALRPFADLFVGSLYAVGGGTLVAPSIKVQWVKDAQAAIARAEGK